MMTIRKNAVCGAIAATILYGWSAMAQQPVNQPAVSAPEMAAPSRVPAGPPPQGFGGPPAAKSPEVAADGSVTFRLLAPMAAAVTLSGSWQATPASPLAMTKDDKGLWTLTLDGLKPEVWTYTFNVDGARMLDPGNVAVQRDGTRYLSMLLVPGAGSALYGEGDVPHGTVQRVWYASPKLGMAAREMYVYTPAGYEDGKTKYPVLYLLHGAGGDEDAWDNMGRAHEIFDHLIATGKAKPMVVVMTNGNANQTAAPGVTPQAPAAGALTPEASIQFGESLVADVVPFVEKHYRVTADRDHRAIAGLSMGGAQSIYTGLNHLDTFSYVASFSGAFVLWPGAMKRVPVAPGSTLRGPGVGQELQMDAVEKTLPGVAAGNNAKLHLLYLSCGMDDGLLTTNRQFMDWLTGKGVVYQKMLLPGYAHVWPFWRISLADLMPQLFTVEPGKGPAKKSKAGM